MQPAKARDYNSVSVFYDEIKQSFELRHNARFWFGSLLSISDRIDIEKLTMDVSKK